MWTKRVDLKVCLFNLEEMAFSRFELSTVKGSPHEPPPALPRNQEKRSANNYIITFNSKRLKLPTVKIPSKILPD